MRTQHSRRAAPTPQRHRSQRAAAIADGRIIGQDGCCDHASVQGAVNPRTARLSVGGTTWVDDDPRWELVMRRVGAPWVYSSVSEWNSESFAVISSSYFLTHSSTSVSLGGEWRTQHNRSLPKREIHRLPTNGKHTRARQSTAEYGAIGCDRSDRPRATVARTTYE